MEYTEDRNRYTTVKSYVLATILMWVMLLLHNQCLHWLSKVYKPFSWLGSQFHWVTGLLFCISYTIAKIITYEKESSSLLVLFMWTLGLYIILYGLYAWPYMLISFVQSLEGHTLLHFIIFLLSIEEITKVLRRYLLKK